MEEIMKNRLVIKTKVSLFCVILLIMLVFMWPVTLMAESENEALKSRIERLEKELGELKAILAQKGASAENKAAPAQEASKLQTDSA
jgi:biopolymer transport protein ExbB/TolQ